MSHFELLLACFLSGQMSEAQMQEHMRDNAMFAAWMRKRVCR